MKIKNTKGEVVFDSTTCYVNMAIREMAESNKEAGVLSTSNILVSGETLRSFNVENYSLPGIEFKGCKIAGSIPKYVDMSEAVIEGGAIEQCNLSTVKLNSALIDAVKVKQTSFGEMIQSRLDHSSFDGCSFVTANLKGSEIINCHFSKGTNFEHSDLSDAKVVGTFDTCNFSNADLRGADFSEATLTCCDLSDAKIDSTTRFKSDPQGSGCLVTNTRLMNRVVHVHTERVNKL